MTKREKATRKVLVAEMRRLEAHRQAVEETIAKSEQPYVQVDQGERKATP